MPVKSVTCDVVLGTAQLIVPPPPPPPRCPPPKCPPVDNVFVQQRDENDYIEPQMVVDNMFDDVLGSLDGKVCLLASVLVVLTV